jgi:3-deoxy-D-manno-octulosonic-acid transferase
MKYALYTAALATGLVGYLPVALWRQGARGVPLHLRARMGRDTPPVAGPTAWVHAVSVGEAIAATALVDGLRSLYPELPVVMTTVTDTGARIVRERFAGVATHRFFPIDLPGAARRVIEAIDPAFLVCMETELWPNTLRAAARRRVPVMIANGRLSDRSFRRYRLVRSFLGSVLRDVSVFAMQSQEDARRIIALGALPERVIVTGNVKNDALPDAAGAVELWGRLLGLRAGQPVWVAGSTHRGEEEAVLDAHQSVRPEFPDLVLVLAPRHPERVREVLDLVAARGWTAVRRSELRRASVAGAATPVRAEGGLPQGPVAAPVASPMPRIIVLDTVGELAQLYAVADIVFMGGSLVPAGGHNMLEPAIRRKPVLTGPHTTNFREAVALLVESGGGMVVRTAGELAAELRRLLADAELREKLGTLAHDAVASRHGAVRATLELVTRFLRPGPTL